MCEWQWQCTSSPSSSLASSSHHNHHHHNHHYQHQYHQQRQQHHHIYHMIIIIILQCTIFLQYYACLPAVNTLCFLCVRYTHCLYPINILYSCCIRCYSLFMQYSLLIPIRYEVFFNSNIRIIFHNISTILVSENKTFKSHNFIF